ncbi:hypothetical protein B0H16DRAFT_1700823, partial [Mycena metata]
MTVRAINFTGIPSLKSSVANNSIDSELMPPAARTISTQLLFQITSVMGSTGIQGTRARSANPNFMRSHYELEEVEPWEHHFRRVTGNCPAHPASPATSRHKSEGSGGPTLRVRVMPIAVCIKFEAHTNFYRAAPDVIYSRVVHATVSIKDSASGVHSAWPGIGGKPPNTCPPATAWARTPTDMALGKREINVFGPRDFAVACRATVVAVLACPGGRLGYLSTVPNHSKVALKINVGTTSQVIAVHQRSTCQSQFKYPQVVSVGMKQRKESATASIGDILLPRRKNSHLHARRDTVVHVDATAVHGTVHRGVRHRAAPCTAVQYRAGRFLTDTHCYCQ